MPKRLDLVFRALADPTRRAVLERLGDRPTAVSELAARFAMSLPSFTQHLEVLAAAGLVRSKKVGRVRTCRLARTAFKEAERWMSKQRALWNRRLNQLDAYLLKLHKES